MRRLLSIFFGLAGFAILVFISVIGIDFNLATHYPDGLPTTPESIFNYLVVSMIVLFVFARFMHPKNV